MAKTEREFSSGGIVIKARDSEIEILLIKDPYGKWTWPKGKIDKDESPIDAAKREIEEETGLKNIRLLSEISSMNYFYTRKVRVYKTVYLRLFEFYGEEALSIQKSEIDDGRWLSEEEALSRIEYKGAKEILKKAINLFKRSKNI